MRPRKDRRLTRGGCLVEHVLVVLLRGLAENQQLLQNTFKLEISQNLVGTMI